MQRKSMSKRYYYLLNTLFHSLCLAGLLWQVTKVSINFFSYEVMKDINIKMPEEVEDKERIFFICIDEDTINMEKCREIKATKDFDQLYNESEVFEDYREGNETSAEYEVVKQIFSAKERLAIFPNVIDVEQSSVVEFFFDDINCFQVKSDDFYMKKSDIETFFIHLSGKSLPYFFVERLFEVPALESLWRIDVNYYFYSISRMEKPYQDKCFNYKTTKQAAIAECIHNMFPGDTFYTDYDLIDENNFLYQNQTFEDVSDDDDAKKCEKEYNQSSCTEKTYFNQLDMMREYDEAVYNETKFYIYSPNDTTSPSFVIESKAKINIIDFVTYIMGALGSWMGFSFLMINPVPLIFQIKDNAVSDFKTTPCGSDRDGISNINEQDSNRMKSRMRSFEYKLHTIDQRLGKIVEDVFQKMSAQEQINIAMQRKLDQILREITALKTSK